MEGGGGVRRDSYVFNVLLFEGKIRRDGIHMILVSHLILLTLLCFLLIPVYPE